MLMHSPPYFIICFSAARFLFTWLMKYFRPAKLLLIAAAADIVCTLFVVVLGGTGWPCVIALIAVSFFMSLMFPTIYGLALDGVEDPAKGGYAGDAKIGASGLIMAILGGSVLPPFQAMIIDKGTLLGMPAVNLSFILPMLCFVVIAIYGLRVHRAKV